MTQAKKHTKPKKDESAWIGSFYLYKRNRAYARKQMLLDSSIGAERRYKARRERLRFLLILYQKIDSTAWKRNLHFVAILWYFVTYCNIMWLDIPKANQIYWRFYLRTLQFIVTFRDWTPVSNRFSLVTSRNSATGWRPNRSRSQKTGRYGESRITWTKREQNLLTFYQMSIPCNIYHESVSFCNICMSRVDSILWYLLLIRNNSWCKNRSLFESIGLTSNVTDYCDSVTIRELTFCTPLRGN